MNIPSINKMVMQTSSCVVVALFVGIASSHFIGKLQHCRAAIERQIAIGYTIKAFIVYDILKSPNLRAHARSKERFVKVLL